jgi:4-amino-4-deoxy-L-arabinose transferase-like glycosyltransferase
MKRQILTWTHFKSRLRAQDRWLESFCTISLLIAALILYCFHLETLPLRDWDEATVAQVAKEISQAPLNSLRWMFPTIWGEPYFNKPPLIHDLIAVFYHFFGVNEVTSRLPSAILTAFSVPLLYLVGRELFTVRTPALCSALVYLTLLPVVRHGRLAMLDGAVICFELLLFLGVLRSRRDLRWTLLAGLGFTLLCLTKGIMGILLGSIALIFLAWDTPRLFVSPYLWMGISLGSLPIIAWYLAQWLRYGDTFIEVAFLNQSLRRVSTSIDGNSGQPWYYLWEIFKYSMPWLVPMLGGLRLAIARRNWSWAKLVLVWSSLYFVAVSVMATKLPWYILPIYPVLALAAGAKIAAVLNSPSRDKYPRSWGLIFATIAIGAAIVFFFVGWDDRYLGIILICLALTFSFAAFLLQQRDAQFIYLIFWGTYISLILFVASPHWIWELNESYPVKNIASIIKDNTPVDRVIYTTYHYERPSLNFYSDRRILMTPSLPFRVSSQPKQNLSPLQVRQLWLRNYWQKETKPYLLIEQKVWKELKLRDDKVLADMKIDNSLWVLLTKVSGKTMPK